MALFKGSKYDLLIIGLGNPGLQYEKTRHNAGFMAVDMLANKHTIALNKHKFNCVFGDGNIGNYRVLIAKPQTFMNLSGKAVVEISQFYKIPTDKILVLFDDISLDVGKIRIRRKGSSGGHNGIKDIIELLGNEDIPRIKIGVGSKPSADTDLKDWVLGKINKEDFEDFNKALENSCLATEEILKSGIDSAMNKYSK